MKRTLHIVTLLLIAAGISTAGGSKSLKWYTFDEAQAQAAKSNKKILVDVYTDWCKWCKKMDEDTYTDAKVMKTLNDKFVVAKVNAESMDSLSIEGHRMTSADFAQAMEVKGYPTILFFDSSGKVITGISSYLQPEQLLHISKFIGDGNYEKMSWEEFEKSYKD